MPDADYGPSVGFDPAGSAEAPDPAAADSWAVNGGSGEVGRLELLGGRLGFGLGAEPAPTHHPPPACPDEKERESGARDYCALSASPKVGLAAYP
jgi:hypothetical protein